MTSGPAFLGELRDRLLDQVLGLLKADPWLQWPVCPPSKPPLWPP
jgi:hypothetical protein